MTAPLLLLLAGLLAQPAPMDLPAPTHTAIHGLLQRLGKALLDGDGKAATQCHDFGDLIEETERRKLIAPLSPKQRRFAARHFTADQATRFANLSPVLNWETTHISRAEPLPGGRLRLTVQHRSQKLQTTFRRRYWVRPGLLGWKIYDYEDVDLAFRISDAVALGINAGRGNEAPPWLAAAQAILGQVHALGRGEPGQLIATMKSIDPDPLPPVFVGLRALLYAAGLVDANQSAEALTVIAHAYTRLTEPMPALVLLRANARLNVGQAAGAQADAEAFLALFPNDPEGLTARGLARLALEQTAAGLADLEAAVAQPPTYLPALLGLLRAAPPARDAHLRTLLEGLSEAQRAQLQGALLVDAVPLARFLRLTR